VTGITPVSGLLRIYASRPSHTVPVTIFIFMQMDEPLPAGASLSKHGSVTNNSLTAFSWLAYIGSAQQNGQNSCHKSVLPRREYLCSVQVGLYFRCLIYLNCNIFLQHRS
jgi:hypothetical protein